MHGDPDWWTPHTDDYAATYDGIGALDDPCRCGRNECVECGGAADAGEEYAAYDAEIRYTIERGRPGYARPTDD